MNSQTKVCQNCKKDFIIEPEDFAFYEKMKVPVPTFCPECRLIRRLCWRNEDKLFKRQDSRTGKSLLCYISQEKPVVVWHRDDWYSDLLNGLDYGRDYDFSKPFFKQIKELMTVVPWPSGSINNVKNSEYSDSATEIKDCYWVFSANLSENCAYCTNLSSDKEVFDSDNVGNCELCYEGFHLAKCHRAFFSSYCENCQDIALCTDCSGLNSCFGCVGLRNKSYHIFNKPYSKEEYNELVKGFNLNDPCFLEETRERFEEFRLKFPCKYMHGRHNTNVSGENIYGSKNAEKCYTIDSGENLKYCQSLSKGKKVSDSYDYFHWGAGAELIYECSTCGDQISNLKFCYECFPNDLNLQYCMFCWSCSDCFGCIGIKNKQYCILNKQYDKEEYEALIPKIISHMDEITYIDKIGRIYKYGEFFPAEISPFAYNETIAQEYFPLTQKQAQDRGYGWREGDIKNYKIDIKSGDLPNNIKDAGESIVGKVIECSHKGECNEQCTTAFKIIKEEFQFYKKLNLPLPRICPNCRHYNRLEQRTPFKLWYRQCMCDKNHPHHSGKCTNEFETSYAPDRPEIIYCEQCYNSEVA